MFTTKIVFDTSLVGREIEIYAKIRDEWKLIIDGEITSLSEDYLTVESETLTKSYTLDYMRGDKTKFFVKGE